MLIMVVLLSWISFKTAEGQVVAPDIFMKSGANAAINQGMFD